MFAHGEPFGLTWNRGREEAASRGQQRQGQQRGFGAKTPQHGADCECFLGTGKLRKVRIMFFKVFSFLSVFLSSFPPSLFSSSLCLSFLPPFLPVCLFPVKPNEFYLKDILFFLLLWCSNHLSVMMVAYNV